ncbi:MAG TPA: SPOR domain-containing protein [Geomonas sp.]|nr:SPOR domain-containing protein [Geomonas sp.]
MVMDYSEKRTVRGESMERKPVQKNRPRKESSGLFALLSIAVLAGTFGAGVLTGWLIFKGPRKAEVAAVAAQPVKKDAPAPAAAPPQQAPAPDAQLTFYKTLPAGGKAAMGSGLNLKKPEPPAHHPAPAAAPAPEAATAPAASGEASQAGASETAKAPEKGATPGRYTVQIASYRDKKEADAAQAKLAAKGMAAYLVESKVPDKGVWYRIRVGKHLSKGEADELAAKSGKGSIVVAE